MLHTLNLRYPLSLGSNDLGLSTIIDITFGLRLAQNNHLIKPTDHCANAGLMLGQRRRRWPNIKPGLDYCIVFYVNQSRCY